MYIYICKNILPWRVYFMRFF